jgi:hypothetical protein
LVLIVAGFVLDAALYGRLGSDHVTVVITGIRHIIGHLGGMIIELLAILRSLMIK